MPETHSDDGTLSSAMGEGGISALPSQSGRYEAKGDGKPGTPIGGEDEDSAPIDDGDDDFNETQKRPLGSVEQGYTGPAGRQLPSHGSQSHKFRSR